MNIKKFLSNSILVTSLSLPLAVSAQADDSEIVVNGVSSIYAQANQVELYVGVVSEKDTVKEAKKNAEDSVKSFFDGIEKLKINKEMVKAEDISIYPNYEYKDRKRILVGYTAKRMITVKLSDFTYIPKVLDLAVASGMNSIEDLKYGVKDPKAIKEQARQEAIKNARENAESLAKGFGVSLGKIKSVVYHSYQATPRTFKASNKALLMDAAVNSVSEDVYTPSDIRFDDEVSVTFYIKD
ncbi:MAG: SIMPL domain-containing protein [Succinivibrionaceae bacterium]